MGTIVVGVDGSANSIAALRWAVAEAKLRGCAVRAVHAWEYPYSALAAPIGAAPPPLMDLQEAAVATLDKAIADAALADDVVVKRVVCQGSPSQVLLEDTENDSAELLVVGARGHGGFAGLLLGSVATQVTHHVEIPTVIVRAPHAR